MFYEGDGVALDKKAAFYWNQKAAEQGLVCAQYNLGLMLCDCDGLAQEKKAAFYWYQKAAEQGLVYAHYNLVWHRTKRRLSIGIKMLLSRGMLTPSTIWAGCSTTVMVFHRTKKRQPIGIKRLPNRGKPVLSAVWVSCSKTLKV